MNIDQPITVHLQALADLRRNLEEAEAQAAPVREEAAALVAPYERTIADLAEQIAETKAAIQQAMTEAGSRRTDPVAGIYVTRAERKTVIVADAQAALAYVQTRPDAADYTTLDAKRYVKLAESALKGEGEYLPGAEVRTTEYVSVKDAA